jgi:biopolymer transport protein ExbD
VRASAQHLNRSRTGFRTLAIKPEIHARGEINVTPLIDVVLVLLIIFMVVTPLAERELAVHLPDHERVHAPSDVSPSQLAVRIDERGTLAINDRDVAPEHYIAQLRELLDGRDPSQRVVFVLAADAVSYPRLVEVMDGARQAGALRVGLAIEGAP